MHMKKYHYSSMPKAPDVKSNLTVKILKAIFFSLFASMTAAFSIRPAFAMLADTNIATVAVEQQNPFVEKLSLLRKQL